MTVFLSARQICETALRKIGAFSINDTAAQPNHLAEAMRWLALRLDHVSSTRRREWLLSPTVNVPLTVAGQRDYELSIAVGASWPARGYGRAIIAWIEDGNGNRDPVTILKREDFENVCRTDESGQPWHITFDMLENRDGSPTMSIWPVPATTNYIVRLIFQTQPADIMPSGVAGDDIDGALSHGLRRTWQLWAVMQLAADLGSGPIRHLPSEFFDRFRAQAKEAYEELDQYEDREPDTSDPICRSGFDDYELDAGLYFPDRWRTDT